MSMKTLCVFLCVSRICGHPVILPGPPSFGAVGCAPCPALSPRHIPFFSASLRATAGLDRSEACPNWNHEVF